MRVQCLAAAGAALSGVLLLTACQGESGEPAPQPTATAPATAALPPPGSPASSPPSLPIRPSPVRPTAPATGEETLTGTVISGVEVGCVLLETDQQDYLLIGAAADDLRVGAEVTIRGQVRTDLATTCQQGVPFEVTEVLN